MLLLYANGFDEAVAGRTTTGSGYWFVLQNL